MRITIEFDCDNDAFQPDPAPELSRILRELADDDLRAAIAHGGVHFLYDAKENRVGRLVVTR